MSKIIKDYKLKIMLIMAASILLFMTSLYASNDMLRLPIGKEDTLEVMSEAMGYFSGKAEFSSKERELNIILEEAIAKNRIEASKSRQIP